MICVMPTGLCGHDLHLGACRNQTIQVEVVSVYDVVEIEASVVRSLSETRNYPG
jgi:hypothetical protein